MAKDKAVRALKVYMDQTGRGPTDISSALSVDRTLIWRWMNGERIPNRENVKGIAVLVARPLEELL